MKKFVKGSLAIVGLMSLGITTASAKTMTAADIDKLTSSQFDGVTVYDTAYVFGKHVYVNMFTMADSVSAANTLDGATDAKLYYKDGDNVWKNAITNEVVDKANLKVEMIKLVGNKNGSHVSNSDIYNAENGYITTEDYLDGRVAEVFTDEQATIRVASVEVIGETNLGTQERTDSNKYNASHTNATLSNGKITLTADAPLLNYTSKENVTGELVGLKVRINREITENDITLNLNDDDYTISLDATKTTATIWVAADKITSGISLEITDPNNSSDSQTVALSYKKPTKVAKVKSDKTYIAETEGVSVTQVKIIDQLYTIFYSDDKDTSSAVVRESGDKQSVTLVDNTSGVNVKGADAAINEMIEIKAPVVAALKEDTPTNANYNFDQKAISNVAMTYDEKEEEYVVKLTRTANLKTNKISLTMDLGVNKGLKADNASVSIDAEKTTFDKEISFAGDGEDKSVTIEYKSAVDNDKIKVRFEFVDAVPAFELKNAKMSNAVDVHTMVSGESLTPNQNLENAAYKNNTNILEYTSLKYDDTDKANPKYVATIQATDETFKTYSSSEEFGLVVDLGINPNDITTVVNSGDKDASVIKTNTTKFGASGTQFVVKVDASKDSVVKFTNNVTNVVTTLEVKVVKVNFVPIKSADLKVIIVDPTSEVKIVNHVNDEDKLVPCFRINKGTSEFRATIDGVENTFEYTFVDVPSDTTPKINETTRTYTKDESVVIRGVEKTDYATGTSEYNQKAVNAVSFDSVTNTIDVKLDATLDTDKGYNIVVDLGKKDITGVSGLTNIADADSNPTTKYYLTVPVTKNADGSIDDLVVETTPNKITVKTTYVKNSAKTYLSLNNAKEISLNGVNIPDAVKANNNGVTATVGTLADKKTTGVVITVDRPIANIDQLVTDYTVNKKVVGLLIDLGTRNVKSDDIKITTDSDLLSKYGATGTQVIAWFDVENKLDNTKEDSTYTITFQNATETNQNDTIDVKFEIKLDIDKLVVNSVNPASAKANSLVSTSETYIKVQNNYTTKYEKAVNDTNAKITITSVKNPAAVDNYTVSGTTTPAKYYGLIVDLGVNSENITASESTNILLDKNNDHAKELGATSNTAFIVWVIDASNTTAANIEETITFTNGYNNESTKLDIVRAVLEN